MEKTLTPPNSLLNHTTDEMISLRITSDIDDSFQRENFVELLRRSLSLHKLDKLRILLELPRLSSNQIISLNNTLEEEKTGLEKIFKEPFDEMDEAPRRICAEEE